MFVAMVLSMAIGGFVAAPAVAGGSDGPTPYTVTADGVTLPGGTTFPASGHVNYKATKLDGTGERSFGVHFDPNNKQPGGRFIGESFFGFTDYPATAQYGAVTNSAASAFPDGYCITWVQVSIYNEHFGEGGQSPVCTGTPPPTAKKVYVCKYVGTPGTDERLQTGQNPIEVSVNAIQNNQWDGTVPGWFSDAHDRSYVIGYVPMTPEPTVASCPQPSGPPTCVSAIDTKDVKAYYTTDPFHAKVEYIGKELCDGVSKTVSLNSYKTDGPTWPTSGTQSFVDHDEYTVDKDHTSGTLVVIEPTCYYQTDLYWGDTKFDGNDGALPHYPDVVTPTGLIDARNGGEGCSTPPTKIDIPATPSSNDPCGPNNATWNVPANTDTLNWAVNGAGHLIVTIVKDNTVFTDGTTKHDFGTVSDSGVACPPTDIPAVPTAPSSGDQCEPFKGSTNDWYRIPDDANFQYTWNGGLIAPGTYPANYKRYKFVAVPKPGIILVTGANDTWVERFTKKDCVKPKRVKGAAWKIDKCGTKADLLKVKKSRGVFYTVRGDEIREGVWLKAGGKRVVIKAHAASDRFELKGKSKWVLRYSQKPCPPPPHNPPNTGQRVIGL
jgi:hypothetical protein